MGSYNLYPGTVINPGQHLAILQKLNPGEKTWISILINAIYYSLDCAFIQQLKEGCQLVVIPKIKVPVIKHYNTYRGCRIAFNKLFKNMAFNEKIKPDWSHFYYPDKNWLEEKQSRIETGKIIGLQ